MPSRETVANLFDTSSEQTRGFSLDEGELYLSLLVAEKTQGKGITTIKDLQLDLESGVPTQTPFTIRVLIARIAAADETLKVCRWVVLLLGALSTSPGEAVMWAYSLVHKTRELGRPVTMADISLDLLPEGWPTQERFHAVWDSQKVYDGRGSDNWLDRPEAYAA